MKANPTEKYLISSFQETINLNVDSRRINNVLSLSSSDKQKPITQAVAFSLNLTKLHLDKTRQMPKKCRHCQYRLINKCKNLLDCYIYSLSR